VISVEEKSRTATIETSKGRTETLNLDAARDRHIAHAYVETTFAAQGRTADHVIVHADSRATNLVDQKSFYVGISRAKASATVFTNDRGRLVSAISERAGQMQTAIAQAVVPSPAAVKAKGAGIG
jgi:ATP-dependent exoDNAse (exonuclease V) alpha subunit